MKLRSSIKPSLLRFELMRGSILAILGVAILLLSAVFIPVQTMQWIGPFIIMISILLITLGLYPYQKLKKLAAIPHEIILINERQILFSWQRKPILVIPLNAIEKIESVQEGNLYGIAVFLKNRQFDAVEIILGFDITKLRKCSEHKYGCDLFFPYFSKRSYNDLETSLQDIM